MAADGLRPYRIALLNSYLQSGNRTKAEVESALRMQQAAVALGLEVKVFPRSEDLDRYRPDIVINLSYQDPKLTEYPTYGTLTMPPSWVANVARFQRNILTYDAYITLSRSVIDYVDRLSRDVGKRLEAVYAAFSAPAREFKRLDFRSAYAAYVGTNWDGARNNDFFLQFAYSDYLRCFGNRRAWAAARKYGIYGGAVPFDGKSVFRAYERAGIGLCINHGDFDAEGIPTSRLFEIPASSNVMIARRNRLVSEIFGDCVLYIDDHLTPYEMYFRLRDQIEWVRANPHRAAEMAREANRIFNENLTLEVFLRNIVDHYERNFAPRPALLHANNEKLEVTILSARLGAQLEMLLECLRRQTLRPAAVHVLLDKDMDSRLNASVFRAPDLRIEQHILFDTSEPVQMDAWRNIVAGSNASWHALLLDTDRPFPRHFEGCVAAWKDGPASFVYSGVVDRTDRRFATLPEVIRDDSLINRREKRRIGYFTRFVTDDERKFAGRIHLGSVLFRRNALADYLRDKTSFFALLTHLARDSTFVFVPQVSLSREVLPGPASHPVPVLRLS